MNPAQQERREALAAFVGGIIIWVLAFLFAGYILGVMA